MKTMRLELDDALHRRLSVYAATHGRTKRDVIYEALKNLLRLGGGESVVSEEVGIRALRGAWKGHRTSKEEWRRLRGEWERSQ